MAAAEAAENSGDDPNGDDLRFMEMNLITKFSSSSKTTEFKNILLWSISQIIRKAAQICTRIIVTNAIKRGIPFLSLMES